MSNLFILDTQGGGSGGGGAGAPLPADIAYFDFSNPWSIAQNFLSGTMVNSDVIATLTASQVLTNKDLRDPSNLFPTATLPTDVAYIDKNNLWSSIQNLPNFSTIGTNLVLSSSGLSQARTFTFPDSTGTVATLNASLQLWSAQNTQTGGYFNFRNNTLLLTNPAVTQNYTVATSAITGPRTITLPLLTGNDIFVFAAFTQALTNKDLSSPTNTFPIFPAGR